MAIRACGAGGDPKGVLELYAKVKAERMGEGNVADAAIVARTVSITLQEVEVLVIVLSFMIACCSKRLPLFENVIQGQV